MTAIAEVERVQGWFGGSDHKTSPSCVYFNVDHHTEDYRRQIQLVLDFIRKLARNRLAELIYADTTNDNKMVVAYRFTSDRYYQRFHSQILNMAPSLGRGCWRPFLDDYQFKVWFGDS